MRSTPRRIAGLGAASIVAVTAMGVGSAGPASAHHGGTKPPVTTKKGAEIARAARWAARPGPTKVRKCESGNNYRISTGNGFYGAWQFSRQTWNGVGGSHYAKYPHQAPKWAQDYMAWRLVMQTGGWSHWECKPY